MEIEVCHQWTVVPYKESDQGVVSPPAPRLGNCKWKKVFVNEWILWEISTLVIGIDRWNGIIP